MLWPGLVDWIPWRTPQLCSFVGACPRDAIVTLPGPTGQPWIAAVVGPLFMRLIPFETVLWHVLRVAGWR